MLYLNDRDWYPHYSTFTDSKVANVLSGLALFNDETTTRTNNE